MIFDKKINLAETVLESAITKAENMDNIMFMESVDDFYMEGEKLDKIKEGTKKFFDTIITAIKEFFEKIQKAIKEKMIYMGQEFNRMKTWPFKCTHITTEMLIIKNEVISVQKKRPLNPSITQSVLG